MFNRNYEYFIAIANEKNISRAAEKLFISQPSLSKFLIQLEKELDTLLFERGRNSLKLTEAGILYLDYIREAQALQDHFEKKLRQISQVREESISLGITPGIASLISHFLIRIFHDQCPGVRLELIEDYGIQIMEQFKRGRIDMVLSMADSLPENSGKSIRAVPVLPDKILFITPDSIDPVCGMYPGGSDWRHPIALPEPFPSSCPVITGKASHILNRKTRRIIEAYNLKPSSVIETYNIDNCLRMVDAGYGTAFIPGMYIQHGPALKHSLIFSIDNKLFDCTRMVYYHADAFTSSQKALVDMIRKVCLQI